MSADKWRPSSGPERLWIPGQEREKLATKTSTGTRNGLPEAGGYRWNRGEKERRQEMIWRRRTILLLIGGL